MPGLAQVPKMASNATVKCPAPMVATSNGVFQGNDPLDYALPLAIVQICTVVVLSRLLAFMFRPLRQPRVIAEIVVSTSFPPFSLFYSFAYFILLQS